MCNFIKSLFCSHSWEVVESNDFYKRVTTIVGDYEYADMIPRKSVILTCKKCGKIKKIIL